MVSGRGNGAAGAVVEYCSLEATEYTERAVTPVLS